MAEQQQYQPVRATESLLQSSGGRPTFEHSSSSSSGGGGNVGAANNNSGKFRNTIVTTGTASGESSMYDAHGRDSFNPSGSGLNPAFAGRATEMKLTAMEIEPGLPAERPRDYKGRYRVRPPCQLCVMYHRRYHA